MLDAFHLLVPGEKWQVVIVRPVRGANCCSSHFHRRSRAPLLPPASAVMSRERARGYRWRPIFCHQRPIVRTAKVAVSWSIPMLTRRRCG
jgi:hypothetical protein